MQLGVPISLRPKNDLSMWGHVTQGRVSHVGEVLLSLTSVKGVIVCINPHWWDWSDDVPPTRVRGRIIKWVSKRAGIEQLSIEWELDSGDDGYIAGQVTYTEPEVSDLSKPSASIWESLSAVVVECLDRGGRGGMGRWVGRLVLV